MKKIISTISLCLLLFLVYSCLAKYSKKIKKIEISSINWSIVTKSPIPVGALWKKERPEIDCDYLNIVEDKEFFSYINEKIALLSELDEKNNVIDARISMLVYYFDDNKIDTLSFGRTNMMKFNSFSYNIDVDLLKKISTYLSEVEKLAIESEY